MENPGRLNKKKGKKGTVVPIAMQSFSQGLPNDPSYPIAFAMQQAVDPVERIKLQCDLQGYDIKEEQEDGGSDDGENQRSHKGNRPSSAPRLRQSGNKPSLQIQQQASQVSTVSCYGSQVLPRPSIVPSSNFSPKSDAEDMKKAMKRSGMDEETILNIISQRCNHQRVKIADRFNDIYGQDLIESLESEMSVDYKDSQTLKAVFKPLAYYEALSLHQAMNGGTTQYDVLIEILCTRTNDEIKDIRTHYKENYLRTLEEDVMGATKGQMRKVLLAMSQADRPELTPKQFQEMKPKDQELAIDRKQAKQDAKTLSAEKDPSKDVLELMVERTFYQLKAVFEEYTNLVGRDIHESIAYENLTPELQDTKDLALCATNPPDYFAERLHASLTGRDKQYTTVIRIFISRAEIDLLDIDSAFYRNYNITLSRMVANCIKKDYKRLLLSFLP